MSVAFSAGALCTHNAQSERNFGPGGNGAGETANGVTRASLAGLKARGCIYEASPAMGKNCEKQNFLHLPFTFYRSTWRDRGGGRA